MRRCVTCEGYLDDSLFPDGGPMCRACVAKLQKNFNVVYAPPEKKTIKEAYVALILAIRDQAEKDDALDEWGDYWLEDDAWTRVWGMLQYTSDQSVHSRDSMYHVIGGLL